MIIHSIRLKNIKSFGEGISGQGITVPFHSGVNRIAGRNGDGKTTIIESLGYALFFSKPPSEETCDLTTYFVRAGRTEGEIDVTFTHGGETYRIERGLGSYNKRRSKVFQLSDGSICAEDDKPVSAFLCRLLEFPCEESLRELFSKLIGVKQGRLTWPFDSKPVEARKFFEPIFDVSVFRECFDRLKPCVDQFLGLRQEQDIKLAGVNERLRERENSPTLLPTKRATTLLLEQQVANAVTRCDEARKLKDGLEGKETAIKCSERERDRASNERTVVVERRMAAEKRVEESLNALELVSRVASSHELFNKAEATLKDLRRRQVEQRGLEKAKEEVSRNRLAVDGKITAAQTQGETFAAQWRAKEGDITGLRAKHDVLYKRLASSSPDFDQHEKSCGQLAKDIEHMRHFIDGLPDHLTRQQNSLKRASTLNSEIVAWNPRVLKEAVQLEKSSEKELQQLRQQLAEANERHKTLLEQSQEIEGGVCPFLREKCRQFDRAAVQADVKHLDEAIKAHQKKLRPVEAQHRTAKANRERLRLQEAALVEKRRRLQQVTGDLTDIFSIIVADTVPPAIARLRRSAEGIAKFPAHPSAPGKNAALQEWETAQRQSQGFYESATAWWKKAETDALEKLDAFEQQKSSRIADKQKLKNWTIEISSLGQEIAKLRNDENIQRESLVTLNAQTVALTTRLTELAQHLESFTSLASDIPTQEKIQENHRNGFLQYLGARPLADQISSRRVELGTLQQAEATASAVLQKCQSALAVLQKDFDLEALVRAREALSQRNANLANHNAELRNAKTDLENEERRFREWQEARADQQKISHEIGRLNAAIELSELARKVLRDSAPRVAQHLCDRIAARAQQIFNQMSHDPIELTWDAGRYSLRIAPGERRFAMLSGGEQTKLALATTLAMIQEFSGLKFCIFDEPTYGVDADSRDKLVDSILQAQEAADLDQLLLVSHDDAFEGKIENAILLKKTAGNGTAVQIA